MKVVLSLLLIGFAISSSAQHKMIEMYPPKAKSAIKAQQTRIDIINAHKYKGVLGEADNAMLALHETKGLSEKQIQFAKELIDKENKDRKIIFDEIAKYNKLSEKEKEFLIRSAFETYRNTSFKGTYYFEKNVWHKKY